MSLEYAPPIDVATSADLQRLAEQVEQTGQPVPLTRDGQVIAVIDPAPPAGPRPSPKPRDDIWASYDPAKVLAGLRASAGILAGVDRDALLADIRAQRGHDSQDRPDD
ncbi:MAG TPA: hypothetical protein VII06_04160 [Chloroflexota bacterium]|jgi:hypothetical protein